mgnify:CR=1 FL=1
MLRFFFDPFLILQILWFLITLRFLFNLDLLRVLPGNTYIYSVTKGKRPTIFGQQSNLNLYEKNSEINSDGTSVDEIANFMDQFDYPNSIL